MDVGCFRFGLFDQVHTSHIDLKYVKEIHHGSEIYSGYEFDQESLSSQHQICVDGNIHAQAIIQWKEIGDE